METTQEAKAACAPERKKENRLLTIFIVMFKMGCVTFGGGWGIIAQMQEEFVDRRGWIEEEDLIDFLSLGRSFPGIMIINTSVIFGYTVAGFWGAVLAAFGLSLPALISIAVVTYFYSAIKSNVIVARALGGWEKMVNPNAKDKQTLALLEALIDWQKEDKLFENQQLLRTPIVRNGRKATVGYQPDVWKDWE